MNPWLLARLREPSTWRGLVWLATVAGLSLRPDQAEAIVLAGMAMAGLLGVFLNDTPQAIKLELPPIDLVSPGPTANRVRELPSEFDAKIDGNGFGDK